jgi:hypothetical protein
MMHDRFLGEAARLPAPHPRRGHGDPVAATKGEWHVATDILETRAPKELAAAVHMVEVGEAVVRLRHSLSVRDARHAEVRELGKLP